MLAVSSRKSNDSRADYLLVPVVFLANQKRGEHLLPQILYESQFVLLHSKPCIETIV